MKPKLLIQVLTIVLLVLGGCASPDAAPDNTDERLLGVWKAQDGPTVEFLNDTSFVEVTTIGFVRGEYRVPAPDTIRMKIDRPYSRYSIGGSYTVEDDQLRIGTGRFQQVYTRLSGETLTKYEERRPARLQSMAERELAEAVQQVNVVGVRSLLESGVNPNAAPRARGGRPMLIHAIDAASSDEQAGQQAEIVRVLLEHGADANVLYGNRSVLEYALNEFVGRNRLSILDFGLDATPSQKEWVSNNLDLARQRQHILTVLLEHGADVQARFPTERLLRTVEGTSERHRSSSEHSYAAEHFQHLEFLARTLSDIQ